MAKSISDMFLSNGHLKTEYLLNYMGGIYKEGSLEEQTIVGHLKFQCPTNSCRSRVLQKTGNDVLAVIEKEEKKGILSRIGSLFHRLFGGNEPFHG